MWLDRPTWGFELKRWLRGTPADPSVFGAVQPIYTAAPVIAEGAADPLPTRLLAIAGKPVVAVPPPEALTPPAPVVGATSCTVVLPSRAHPYVRRALERAAHRIANSMHPGRHPTIVGETTRLARFVEPGLVTRDSIAAVVRAAARQAGKDDEAEIDACIAWGLEHPWTAGPLPGVGAMADGSMSAAEAIVDGILGSAEDCAIAEVVTRFNGMFMVVNEGGKAVILQPGFDPVLKRRRYDRLAPTDLRVLYLNERIPVGVNKDGSPVLKCVADVWLHHPERRQFIHGMVFDPSNRTRPCVLNLLQGYAVKPAPGDWSLMQDHIQWIICDGDPIRLRYTMGWLARMFQHPDEQGEVAIVMKGGEGTGKGTLAKAVKHIIGHHALAIANGKHLVGAFNSHLRDVVFLFADEAFFAGDRAHVGVLKSIITEPYLTVEGEVRQRGRGAEFPAPDDGVERGVGDPSLAGIPPLFGQRSICRPAG